MTSGRWWHGASRRLILSFVVVLLVPAAAVVWLGVAWSITTARLRPGSYAASENPAF
jgi:hypothetical protein